MQTYSKAVTKQGLIKNDSRHEKDDRPIVLSKDNYVLGWDNKEKIKLTRDVLKVLDKQIKNSNEDLGKLEKRQKRLEQESRNIVTFLTYDSFSDINWRVIASQIKELQEKKISLEKSSNKIKELKKQHDGIKKKIEQDEKEEKDLSKQEWTFEESIKTIGKNLVVCEGILEPFKEFDLSLIHISEPTRPY